METITITRAAFDRIITVAGQADTFAGLTVAEWAELLAVDPEPHVELLGGPGPDEEAGQEERVDAYVVGDSTIDQDGYRSTYGAEWDRHINRTMFRPPAGVDPHDPRFPQGPTRALTFGDAVEHLKAGRVVQRDGWNGPGQYLQLVNNARVIVDAPGADSYGDAIAIAPHIVIKPVHGDPVPWLASQTDILATDWRVIG